MNLGSGAAPHAGPGAMPAGGVHEGPGAMPAGGRPRSGPSAGRGAVPRGAPRDTAQDKLPRGLLIGAGALVAASLLLVSVARITGYRPAQPPASAVVASSDLHFVDRGDGAVLIYADPDGRLVDTLEPGTNGFVRGVLRGLVRERNADHIGAAPPFRLTRWADGRLSLDDTTTGRHVDLEVFGPTNAGAFADILIASGQHKERS